MAEAANYLANRANQSLHLTSAADRVAMPLRPPVLPALGLHRHRAGKLSASN
jgi:hypothetical protein